MRWMMRIMRLTLLARSEMISMFEAGYATRWPYCGISGRSTGTSCAALTLRTRDDLRDELVGVRR